MSELENNGFARERSQGLVRKFALERGFFQVFFTDLGHSLVSTYSVDLANK
jgi:hypothetical protein